jgi:hypothetical protein
LDSWLKEGISSCTNCSRIFHSGEYYKILAAGWAVRHNKIKSKEALLEIGLTEEQANIVSFFVLEEGISHDEMLEVLEGLNISEGTIDSKAG